jgi:lipase chaperone LimK
MSAGEKAEALRGLSEKLPRTMAVNEEKEREEAAIDMEIERMRRTGDRGGLFALRKERYGNEAAERLADLDDKQDSLDRRIREFNRTVKRIEGETGLSFEEKAKRISDLKSKTFAEWERPLVHADTENMTMKGEKTL